MELLYRFPDEIKLQIARSCWEAEKKEIEAFRWAINVRANEYTNSSLGIGICRCLFCKRSYFMEVIEDMNYIYPNYIIRINKKNIYFMYIVNILLINIYPYRYPRNIEIKNGYIVNNENPYVIVYRTKMYISDEVFLKVEKKKYENLILKFLYLKEAGNIVNV